MHRIGMSTIVSSQVRAVRSRVPGTCVSPAIDRYEVNFDIMQSLMQLHADDARGSNFFARSSKSWGIQNSFSAGRNVVWILFRVAGFDLCGRWFDMWFILSESGTVQGGKGLPLSFLLQLGLGGSGLGTRHYFMLCSSHGNTTRTKCFDMWLTRIS